MTIPEFSYAMARHMLYDMSIETNHEPKSEHHEHHCKAYRDNQRLWRARFHLRWRHERYGSYLSVEKRLFAIGKGGICQQVGKVLDKVTLRFYT